jgi:hypothetical protein
MPKFLLFYLPALTLSTLIEGRLERQTNAITFVCAKGSIVFSIPNSYYSMMTATELSVRGTRRVALIDGALHS